MRSKLLIGGLFASLTLLAACSESSDESADPVEPSDAAETAEDVSTDDADETESDVAGGDTGRQPGAGSTVTPRWVLYDADGEAVEAIVRQPTAAQHQNLQPGDAVDSTQLSGDQCVRVTALNEHALPPGIEVELSSGRFAPCMRRSSRDLFFYRDSSCTGTPYDHDGNAAMIDGEVYLPEGTIVDGNDVYQVAGDGSCEQAGAVSNPVVPLESAPDWLSGAFDNPPYEVKPVYD